MALTEEQLEIISDALLPLFQYLESQVIIDVAKRIKNTMSLTRTSEIMAESMQRLGYSPAKIRQQAMKMLKADPDFQKEVAENTLAHKKKVKELLEEVRKEFQKRNDTLTADCGDMSYFDDLETWEQNGKQLQDKSYLPQLVHAIQKQTADTVRNLTQTTGFKSMYGYEAMESLYQKELDKAMIKLCTGTFSKEEIVYETVHSLAESGLRTIDFSSGWSMQLDTAVKLAVRTGNHQLSGKIMDANIMQTGENLVYVSKHWGARNKGTGHANHQQWQGRVYFVKGGQDYTEEARRIGQDYITDLWYATGYSVDGERENDPLGLYGYNCRHSHHVWFEGVSNYPQEDPEPKPVTIKGKKYDYYALTQKQRTMERSVRALKREREALKALGMDTKDITKKIRRKMTEYEDFCKDAKVKANVNRMRYEPGTSNLNKTKAWKKYSEMKAAAGDAVRNTGKKVDFNPEYDYSVKLDGYSEDVNKGLSAACRKVAELGGKDHNEHMYLVDLENGDLSYYETNGLPNEVGYYFWGEIRNNPNKKYAFIHNHNTDGMFSETDMRTMLNTEQIPVMIAVRNDAVKYIAERSGKVLDETIYDDIYMDEIKELNEKVKNGIIDSAHRTKYREVMIVENLLRDYTKGGSLIEQDGRR